MAYNRRRGIEWLCEGRQSCDFPFMFLLPLSRSATALMYYTQPPQRREASGTVNASENKFFKKIMETLVQINSTSTVLDVTKNLAEIGKCQM